MRRPAERRRSAVLVTFDFEAHWGMPHGGGYDAARGTAAILETLGRHHVSAVFFVTGKLVEERAGLVTELGLAGHEVGLHGYRHEDFGALTPPAREELASRLGEVCAAVADLTGRPPVAYRAPYLLAPSFADADLDRMLERHGFVWTSNREIRFCEEVFRPDRVPSAAVRRAADAAGLFDDRPLGVAASVALNLRLLQREQALGNPAGRLRWLVGGRGPYRRGPLVEVALQAPLDCDLVGLPRPEDASDDVVLGFAAERMAAACERRGEPCVLAFHDWIVGSGNRISLLDETLGRIRSAGAPVLEATTWSPA